ncbi:hypothetical protein BOW53_12420 [Solemya pervernicosa gill symbiont]|uniref:Uncharacterized protein n=2 Tax=Gammaproteobacteria incertae sedis TaxID=118884 RepID=A0A1T2L2D2_9GAMM|nr:hypothetical protein [Candidatus Reidiella endopervernicosa]OOZ39257.1 hypothetical protein BOW53_12420 [Solemya pervernicosa gill symbiont]QKQ25615.1 hypothetical protein HUE57_04365 [Candidatus Reidiella endopervernicosa]
MPQLPSGKYVEIMSERARYHARRLKLRVTSTTPHRQLYPLVDILIDPTNNTHGCRGCTTFSGHTLADHEWLDQFEEGDRRWFANWLREAPQRRVIEQARTRLLAARSTASEEVHDYPSQLYSQLRDRIEALPQQRASAEQWQRTLLNMRRDGLRREELDWSRLPEFLSEHAGEAGIDKAALLESLDFTQIVPRLSNDLECDLEAHLPFTEVAKRIPTYQLQMSGYPIDDQDLCVVRYRCESPSYRIGSVRPHGRALHGSDQPRWFLLAPYGKVVTDSENSALFFPTSEAALQAADNHARSSHRLRPALTYSKPYEYMSLHGGEAYREWLVTLPDYHRSHFTAHYHERNVLLHIRTKIRHSEDGSKVLFIEELQSDWQQAIAQHGLHSGIPLAPFRKEWASLALKLMLMHVVKSDLDGIAWADGAVHALRYDREMGPLMRLYDQEIPQILTRLAKPWQASVERAYFETRSPWLHAARCDECWKVEGGAGKFSTRPRYDKSEALALIQRHTKALSMSLPILRLSAEMKRHIAEHGLPLFGEQTNKPTPLTD